MYFPFFRIHSGWLVALGFAFLKNPFCSIKL